MNLCLVNHYITGHPVFVLVYTDRVMQYPANDNAASCEIRTLIRFLHAKNMSATEIIRELCAVYGQNLMNDGTITQWCRMFKHGRTVVHDKERSGRPSVMSDNLVQSVHQKSM
jgi:transposase